MGLFNHSQKSIFPRQKGEQRRACDQLEWQRLRVEASGFYVVDNDPESPALKGKVASLPLPVIRDILLPMNFVLWQLGQSWVSRVLPISPLGL